MVTCVTPIGTTNDCALPSLPLVPLYENVHVARELTVGHPAAEAGTDDAETSSAPMSAPVATTERLTRARRPGPNTLIAMSHLDSRAPDKYGRAAVYTAT